MIFIKYNSITIEETIDVRSVTEFKLMPLFKYNIPIINEEQHFKIKRFYPKALFIIIYSLFKNKNDIKSKLLKISKNKTYPIVIGCSRGRLRSPIMYIYAKLLGIKHCKILLGGLKPLYINTKKSQ